MLTTTLYTEKLEAVEAIKSPGPLASRMPGLPSHLRARSCKPGYLDTPSLCRSRKISSRLFDINGAFNSLYNGLEVRIRHFWSYVLPESSFYTVKTFPAYRTNQIAFCILRRAILVEVILGQSDNIIYIKFRWRRRQRDNHCQIITVGQFACDDYYWSLFAHFGFYIASKIANKNRPTIGMPCDPGILYLCTHSISIVKTCFNINFTIPRLMMASR